MDAEPYTMLRAQRDELAPFLAREELPEGSRAQAMGFGGAPIADRVSLRIPMLDYGPWKFQLTVAEGSDLTLETSRAERLACGAEGGIDLCREPFESDLPSPGTVAFPRSVPVKVTPLQVPGEALAPPAIREALRVQLYLTEANSSDLAGYFSVGYGAREVEATLARLLGRSRARWIDVQDLWDRWIGPKVNTFPTRDDNDVCHAPAREFFYFHETPVSSAYARSTEAVGALLHRYYCPVGDDVEPRFGDYLWVPGAHSGRYILKDPATGRGISFSIQSGGNVPYRLFWMDEDFSEAPFGHEPSPDLRKRRLDVWRRCRRD